MVGFSGFNGNKTTSNPVQQPNNLVEIKSEALPQPTAAPVKLVTVENETTGQGNTVVQPVNNTGINQTQKIQKPRIENNSREKHEEEEDEDDD
jgi:hypothetical protein